jgi:predicted transglutaminase-like cysteine proteinase
MRPLYLAVAGVSAWITATASNASEMVARHVMQNAFMQDYGVVSPPPAFNRFCEENPTECLPQKQSASFSDSPERLEQLDRVNREVNRAIKPETDIEHYGIEDYWTLPRDGKGDCEDYALLKRHILLAMGWPSSALLMTVVRIENGEGHAVLSAKTRSGDFILDNRTDVLKLWYQTSYSFKMRQSVYDPKVWLDLDPSDDALPAPISVPGMLYDLSPFH